MAMRWTAAASGEEAARDGAAISETTLIAFGSSEQMSTSDSMGWSRWPSSVAGRWWNGHDPAVRHGRLRRNHQAGRDEGWNSAHPHQRVGHADHDLAAEAECVLVRRRRQRVPWRGDDDQVGLGGVVVG
jgi:hypothetical protein